jgi:hypothetical protein
MRTHTHARTRTRTHTRARAVHACRLWQTREVLHQCLINPQLSVRQSLEDTDSYLDVQVLGGGRLARACVHGCCCMCMCTCMCMSCGCVSSSETRACRRARAWWLWCCVVGRAALHATGWPRLGPHKHCHTRDALTMPMPHTHIQHTCHTPVTHLSHTCHTPVTHLSHTCHTCHTPRPGAV